MTKQKLYVVIQSNTTIQVTCGLQLKDVTNADAHVADRLKVSPLWPTCSVIIHQGQHTYPSEIAEWKTVKALERDGILTIGAFVDNADEATMKEKETLVRNLEKVENEVIKNVKLADIAGEE